VQWYREVKIHSTLAEVCDPRRMALLVYDMQVGVLSQIADAQAVTTRVCAVLETARGRDAHAFTRHLTLPLPLTGASGLRTAMAWQHIDDVTQVVSTFPRDSPAGAVHHRSRKLHIGPEARALGTTAAAGGDHSAT
jgi:biuret amidohydrolase